MCFPKTPPKTQFSYSVITIKINALSSKSNYQKFAFEALINLIEIDHNKTFILALDLTLVTIMKSQNFYSWNLA